MTEIQTGPEFSHELRLKEAHITETNDGHTSIVGFSREGNKDTKRNEDALKYKIVQLAEDPPRTVTLVALADGVGRSTSPFSDIGADKATDSAIEILGKNAHEIVRRFQHQKADAKKRARFVDTNILIPIKKNWIKKIQELSNNKSPELMQYATTLMLAVVTDDVTAVIRIGHNDACVQGTDGTVRSLRFNTDERAQNDASQDDWNAINGTITLAHPNPNRYAELTILYDKEKARSLLMHTDGLTETTPEYPATAEQQLELINSIFNATDSAELAHIVPQKVDDVSFVRVTPAGEVPQAAEEKVL